MGTARTGASWTGAREGARGALAAAALAPLLLLVACSGGSSSPDASTDGATATSGAGEQELSGSLTVFAAASLTGVFADLESRFEAANPGVDVQVSYAGSSDLSAQITAGAPADVYASADERTMQQVVDAGLVAGEPSTFATNVLTVVTPPDNPGGVESSADLADPDLDVVVCAPQVPCGAATQQVEEATGLDIAADSEVGSVTDVLGTVTSGQADAGVVYVTDAVRAGEDVAVVPLEGSQEAVNTYPVAELVEAADPALAQAFVDLVLSTEGQEVLAAAGFGAPQGS
ncbi:molybdate ABC transporter substrate-binding protein [Pseudokineococcus sp. 1T1Z-3]|uniref:molybdate ABC transporter substrate-binding protein n=1 Tax=Pseudokineococcus sp. 1T1Z-3 TaxID=3132745 RepID=UPI00403F702D